MEAKLVIVAPESASGEYKLKLPTTIGRGRDASLKLLHPLVSRLHCEVFESDDGYLNVRDLGSLNGTFVAGEKITEARLRAGELLTVGTVTFQAVYDAPAGEMIDEEATAQVGSEATVDEGTADVDAGEDNLFAEDSGQGALAGLDFSDDSVAESEPAEAEASVVEEEPEPAAAAASGDSDISLDFDQPAEKGGGGMAGFTFLGQPDEPEDEVEAPQEPSLVAPEASGDDDMNFDMAPPEAKEDEEFSLNIDTSEDTGVVDQEDLQLAPPAAEADADLPPAADAEPAEAEPDSEPWSLVPESQGEDEGEKKEDDWNDFFKDLK